MHALDWKEQPRLDDGDGDGDGGAGYTMGKQSGDGDGAGSPPAGGERSEWGREGEVMGEGVGRSGRLGFILGLAS